MAWRPSWRERLDIARVSVVKAGRQAAGTVHRVAVQGMDRAKLHGAKLARHIVAVQKSAGASDAMIRESAKSVANRALTREGDRAWQQAYVAEAAKHVRGLKPELVLPALTCATGTLETGGPVPGRPQWPHAAPSGDKADPEAGQ